MEWRGKLTVSMMRNHSDVPTYEDNDEEFENTDGSSMSTRRVADGQDKKYVQCR